MMGMYKFVSRLFQILANVYFIMKVTLMLPKEPGPGLEPYERITMCKFVNGWSVLKIKEEVRKWREW